MAKGNARKKELTGRHVLVMLLAFFGVMFAVNGYFTVAAVSSFRGEDVPRSYRQGLEYNKTIEARTVQTGLGWTARTNLIETEGNLPILILMLQDADGRGLEGVSFEAVLRHPTDTMNDTVITFEGTGAGRYVAPIDVASGNWDVRATAIKGLDRFKLRQKIWVN